MLSINDSLATDSDRQFKIESMRSVAELDYEANSDRYLAESDVYNDSLFGAIRPGGPVRVFSSEYCGLLVSGTLASFVYQILRDCLRYQLQLLDFEAESIIAAERVVDSTAIFAFFVGVISDCKPLLGYNRKSYMVIGWFWACLQLAVLAIISNTSKHHLSYRLFVGFAGSCSFGTMVAYVAGEIRLVELSQRETLISRGFLVAIYTVLRISGQAAGRVMSRFVLDRPSWGTVRAVLAVHVVLCAIAAVCIHKFLREPYSTTPKLPWCEGYAKFWKLIQQRVVRYIIAFTCLYSAFSNVRIRDADKAVAVWADVGPSGEYTARICRDLVALFTVTVWAWSFRHTDWIKFFMWGPLFNAIPSAMLGVFVGMAVYNEQWFYFALSILSGVADGIFRIAYLVPLVEICVLGSEGQTVGLVLSFDKLLAILTRTASSEAFHAASWNLTSNLIEADSRDARDRVVTITVAGNALRLMGVFALVFLPSQKLDAHQRLAFGVNSAAGGAVIMVAFVLSFMGVLAINFSLYF